MNSKPVVTLSSVITLSDLSPKQERKVRDSLTYENPEYKNALKFSGYNRISLPTHLKYYESTEDGLEVPLGFDYKSLTDFIVRDKRANVPCEIPELKLSLREDQEEAVSAFVHRNEKGINGLIQLPTGKGKSIVGLAVAERLQQRTLVIVHKKDLLRGWVKDIELAFGGKIPKSEIGIFGDGKKVDGKMFTIATVQTLNRLDDYTFNTLKDAYGLVICDECHHCPSASYNLLNDFSARYKMGLSATPERKDGLTHLMNDFLGGFCYRYQQRGDEKDILPVDVYLRSPKVYFNPVCKVIKVGQFHKRYELSDSYAPSKYVLKADEIRYSDIPWASRPKISYMDIEEAIILDTDYSDMVIEDMVSEIEYAQTSCIAFFRKKEHCKIYKDLLIEAGVDENLIQIYNGDCSAAELERCLARAETEKPLITLTTYSKSSEGTNVRGWEVGFLVGSLNDGKMTEQAVGRIRRLKDNKLSVARLYDYCPTKAIMLPKHRQTRLERYQVLGFNLCKKRM